MVARETIADLLGWGVLVLLIVMVVYVVRGRQLQKQRKPDDDFKRSDGTPLEPRAVVAITAYNDAEATAQAVKDFRQQPGVVKVLVIDNNSTDDTAALAEAAGAAVIRESRQGYGYACIRGLAEGLKVTEANVIVLTEGDGTFFAEDTAKFLAYIDNADLVVGNRVVRGLIDTDSQMDHFFTWGNMAVAMLLRLRFWDGRHLGAGRVDGRRVHLPRHPPAGARAHPSRSARRRQPLLAAHASGGHGPRPVRDRDSNPAPAPRRTVEGSEPELLEGTPGWGDDDLAHHDLSSSPPEVSPLPSRQMKARHRNGRLL